MLALLVFTVKYLKYAFLTQRRRSSLYSFASLCRTLGLAVKGLRYIRTERVLQYARYIYSLEFNNTALWFYILYMQYQY